MTDNTWLKTTLLLSDIESSIRDDLLHTNIYRLSMKAIFALHALYEKDGQRLSDLATAVGNLTTTFSWVVVQLEKYELVERRVNKNDGRSPLIYLTSQGKQLQKVIENAIANAEVKYGEG